MKEPSPRLSKYLSLLNALFFTVYFFTVIFIEGRPPKGPYGYSILVAGALLISIFPYWYAETEAWPSFALGVFGLVVSGGLALTLFAN